MRVLALDWGTVRIGAAISDEDGKIAFPLDRVIGAKTALEEIKNLITKFQVSKVVLGLPKNTSGQEGKSAKAVQKFARKVRTLSVPVDLVDERFSSVEALHKAKIYPPKKARQIKDNLTAQILLQQYLDTKNN